MKEKLTVGELVYKISGDVKDLQVKLDKSEKELKKIQSEMVKTEKGSKSLGKSFSLLKLTIAGFVTGALFKLRRAISDSITNASELGESVNAVNVVFGQGSEKILEFGKNAAQSVGLANSEFNQLSTVTGALLKDTGLSMDEVSERTIDLTKRAADMASVYNTDVKDALSAINQAIRGETEAIRRYAGNVTDAEIKQELLSRGINKSVTELTEQEKRLYRLDIIMRQTSITAGDFANTSDEVANKARILKAEIKDKSAELGNKLLPLYSKWIDFASAVVDNTDRLITVIKTLFSTLGTYIATTKVVTFFSNFSLAVKGATTALITLRTVLTSVAGSLGVVAAATAAAVTLIRDAAGKVVKAWEKADEAQLDSSNKTLQLLKMNIERRKLAEADGSRKVQDLAQAEFDFQKGLIDELTNEEMKALAERRDAARKALKEDEEATKEWEDIKARAQANITGLVDETTDSVKASTDAIDEQAEKLEQMTEQLVSLAEQSKATTRELKENLTDSLTEANSGLAKIVIDAEENIKSLKEQIRKEEDRDRKKQLKAELDEQKAILDARADFEERQAERITSIREKLSAVGIQNNELDELLNVQTLEEQIQEERRIASLDEFTRFEELQNKKIDKIVDDIITRRQLEMELTSFLESEDSKRLKSVENFANTAIEKYGDMATSLRSAISLQQRLNALRSNPQQFHDGGYVGASGGEVHAGEYVIPANLVGQLGTVVSSLENLRMGGGSITNNKNINAPITLNANVQEAVDFSAISKELAWEINKR